MSMLQNVTKGKIPKPYLVLVYGPDGVGKSTFASKAPKPIFLGVEEGTANLDVTRFPKPKSFQDALNAIHELTTDKHDYETLVVDSIDWLESMVHAAVCEIDGAKTIASAQGGYNKGYELALNYWKRMHDALSELRETKKMNIVLIAHSQVKPFNDPTQNLAYDRFQLKLYDKAAALWREYVDNVFFANHEVVATKEKNDKKAKTFGDDKRIMFTERRPSFDAKNRLNLPFELPFEWDAFVGSVKVEDHSTVLSEIEKIETKVKNPKTLEAMKKAVKDAGVDVVKLKKIRDHALTIAEL